MGSIGYVCAAANASHWTCAAARGCDRLGVAVGVCPMAGRRIWERSCPGRWVWVQRWRHGFWPATTGVHGQNKSRVTLVKNSTGWFSWVPPLLLVGKHLLYSFGVVAVWLYQIDQHQKDRKSVV